MTVAIISYVITDFSGIYNLFMLWYCILLHVPDIFSIVVYRWAAVNILDLHNCVFLQVKNLWWIAAGIIVHVFDHFLICDQGLLPIKLSRQLTVSRGPNSSSTSSIDSSTHPVPVILQNR